MKLLAKQTSISCVYNGEETLHRSNRCILLDRLIMRQWDHLLLQNALAERRTEFKQMKRNESKNSNRRNKQFE